MKNEAMGTGGPGFLLDADSTRLEQAAAENHRELFRWIARSVNGTIHDDDDVTWTYAGPYHEAVIAFPEFDPDSAGERIDEIIHFYVTNPPKGLVGCWSLDPTQPHDLGARLLARGFQPGWRPCWMALDLTAMNCDHVRPATLRIESDADTSTLDVPNLPYTDPGDGAGIPNRFPDRATRFLAFLDGRIAGQSMVLYATGYDGVAGVYNVGVVPEARNRGIGKAVTLAACMAARERGYRYAILNATGRRIYEQVGFRWIGDGWTWWLDVPRTKARPPSKDEIALAEAIGRSDIDDLDRLSRSGRIGDLNGRLTNDMTPIGLAIDLGRNDSAEWLLKHGASVTPLDAWSLGWKERAKEMLLADPARVNERYGEEGATLLHEAARRGDIELARLALSHGADSNLTDTAHLSTPAGWADHMGRSEIRRVIEEQDGRSA